MPKRHIPRRKRMITGASRQFAVVERSNVPYSDKLPDGAIHLQHFDSIDEAKDMIDTYDYMLKNHKKYKNLDLICSRPRPEAGGFALYAIPRPK